MNESVAAPQSGQLSQRYLSGDKTLSLYHAAFQRHRHCYDVLLCCIWHRQHKEFNHIVILFIANAILLGFSTVGTACWWWFARTSHNEKRQFTWLVSNETTFCSYTGKTDTDPSLLCSAPVLCSSLCWYLDSWTVSVLCRGLLTSMQPLIQLIYTDEQ